MICCDVQSCVGCRTCEVACADFHFGAVSPALSRIRVAKLEEIGIDLAIACVACAERPCLECPTEALSVGEQGQICVAEDLCTGCEACVHACPIGAIGFFDDHPLFCDLCGGDPQCVAGCPTRALAFENKSAPSLATHSHAPGEPARRRAAYARSVSAPVREKWMAGWRMGP
ncbi:MAG: 4Fe-4S dicluster domain-containing protein [Myxococcota bacterium]|nr:4Fe-4S dicluster domain-containing protein [Myxococcota bacterium]